MPAREVWTLFPADIGHGFRTPPIRAGRRLLRELVAGLEADRRDAFVLTHVVGLSYAGAAEVCGCPVATIGSRVARAREDLIRAMHRLGWRCS